jgi:hypothetical protein
MLQAIAGGLGAAGWHCAGRAGVQGGAAHAQDIRAHWHLTQHTPEFLGRSVICRFLTDLSQQQVVEGLPPHILVELCVYAPAAAGTGPSQVCSVLNHADSGVTDTRGVADAVDHAMSQTKSITCSYQPPSEVT